MAFYFSYKVYAEATVQVMEMNLPDHPQVGEEGSILSQACVVQLHSPTEVRISVQFNQEISTDSMSVFPNSSPAWQKLRVDVIGFLEDQRQEIRKNDMVHDYKKRIHRVVAAISKAVQSVPQPRVNPPNGYFIRSQRFSALIRDDTVDTVAFDTQLQSLMPLVPDMIASWVAACNGKLLDLLGSDREGDPHLELSTTFFKCGRCNDPISYPRILMHSCLRDTPRGTIVENLNGAGTTQDEDEEEEDNEESDELDNEAEELHVQPIREQITPERVWNQILSWYNAADWNEGGDQVFVDDEATGVANIIVKVCGEDPATATVSRMDSNDSRLECLRCCRSYKSKPSKRLIMNWKTAVRASFSLR